MTRAEAKRSPGNWGQAILTRRYRSALVAALACASLFAAGLASEAAAKRGGAKSAPAATAKAAGKAAKHAGKKAAAGKSKGGKSTKEAVSQKSVVPQIPLAQGPAPQTPELRNRAGQERDRGAAQGRRQQGDRRRGRHLRPGGAQAGRMDHFAQRPQRRQQQALPRFHRRQSELAQPRHVPPPRRGDAVGRERQAGAGARPSSTALPPQSGHGPAGAGRARSTAQGDTETASALVRETGRNDSLSADVREASARTLFLEFLDPRPITRRAWRKRLAALDYEDCAAGRAAGRGPPTSRSRRRASRSTRKAGKTKKLVEAVPAEARSDPATIRARPRPSATTTRSTKPRQI